VELVVLPTHASWLSWIEPEFAALRYFVLTVQITAPTPGKAK
jgi:hypothetical protein